MCVSWEVYRFVLPVPPSVNHLYVRRWDRVVLNDEVRRYYDLLGHLVRAEAAKKGWAGGGAKKDVRVEIVVYFPDRRRRDLDNVLKAVLDGAFPALGLDDSAIDDLRIVRGEPDPKNPRAELAIRLRRYWSAGTSPLEGVAENVV